MVERRTFIPKASRSGQMQCFRFLFINYSWLNKKEVYEKLPKKESTSLLEAMNEIVNVRRYTDQPIPQNIEEELFYAFSLGPSSVNVQARELLVIDELDQRQKVVESTLDPYLSKGSYGGQAWILDAPLVCIALIEKRRAMARVGEKGLLVAIQDLASAVQNFRQYFMCPGI